MKKILKTTGIVLGVLVVAIAGIFFYMRNEIKDLRPAETARINDTTFIVKGGIVDIFLVGKGTGYVAIDAGDNVKKIASSLASLSINPDFVKAVFLTHSDADHTAGLPLFKNAHVYLSKKELPVLSGAAPRHFLFITHKNKLPVSSFTTLNDMDTVIIDRKKIIAIPTPGHTVGSMCFQIGSMLFTGDLCILKNNRIEPMVRIFTEDRPTDSLSIRHVAQLPDIDFIGTAHTGVTRDMTAAFAKWR
jgi:glyoxylase-like metal-dependent hydrolase (beta-lactamase superfamily II)